MKFKQTNKICSLLKISLEMQERNYESKKFFRCSIYRKTCQFGKKTEDGDFFFKKGLTNRFWLTMKSCSWLNNVHGSMIDLLSNGRHINVMIYC